MMELKASTRFSRTSAIITFVAIVMAIGASIWFTFRPSREMLLKQALDESRRDPVAAERMLRQILQDARGKDPDAAIALGRLLLHRNAFKEAAELYRTVDPAQCRPDVLLVFARDGLKTPLRKQSLAGLSLLAEKSGLEQIPALELLLADYQEWGQHALRLDVATALTRLQPEVPRLWEARIEELARLEKKDDCRKAIDEALRIDFPAPDRPSGKRRVEEADPRGELLEVIIRQLVDQQDVEAARNQLDRLTEIEGESVRVNCLEVSVSRLEKKLDRALEFATSAVGDSRSPYSVRFERGLVLFELGRFEEAVQEFERVVAIRPFDSNVRAQLAETYRRLERTNDAEKEAKRAAEIAEKQSHIQGVLKQRESDPQDPAIYEQLEQLSRELGDLPSAQSWRQWAIRCKVFEKSES